jgi:hypothetical protein
VPRRTVLNPSHDPFDQHPPSCMNGDEPSLNAWLAQGERIRHRLLAQISVGSKCRYRAFAFAREQQNQSTNMMMYNSRGSPRPGGTDSLNLATTSCRGPSTHRELAWLVFLRRIRSGNVVGGKHDLASRPNPL